MEEKIKNKIENQTIVRKYETMVRNIGHKHTTLQFRSMRTVQK